MKPQVKSKILLQSYKHDKHIHRSWLDAFVVESDDDKVVCITDNSEVVEDDGKYWITKEPAVYILYYKEWFNVIAMLRKSGIYFYCNIASPCVFDNEGLKNIDYDLDVKIYPDGRVCVLDQEEYKYHKKKMSYSDDLDQIINYALDKLLVKINNHEYPFNEEIIKSYYQKYLELKGESND